jgi:hypothetical protein
LERAEKDRALNAELKRGGSFLNAIFYRWRTWEITARTSWVGEDSGGGMLLVIEPNVPGQPGPAQGLIYGFLSVEAVRPKGNVPHL